MLEGLFQPMHLILVLAITLLVFGPGKLPELGKSLGESIRELKKALNEGVSGTQQVSTGATDVTGARGATGPKSGVAEEPSPEGNPLQT